MTIRDHDGLTLEEHLVLPGREAIGCFLRCRRDTNGSKQDCAVMLALPARLSAARLDNNSDVQRRIRRGRRYSWYAPGKFDRQRRDRGCAYNRSQQETIILLVTGVVLSEWTDFHDHLPNDIATPE